jgi:23S rRNA (adenine2503-C2)-methyltransferase
VTHRVDLLSLSAQDLELFVLALGQPAYRVAQIFAWLHRGASIDEMTNLPQPVRGRIKDLAVAGTLARVETRVAPDGTAKFAFRTWDEHVVESVFIPHADHNTVCVSSQIGCAYGCPFCATGQQGLVRSLTAGEIVEQVVRVQREQGTRRVRNVVFMGMGEPLANYQAVLRAVRLLNQAGGLHIGARHIAISTCGLPAEIRELAGEGLQLNLSISLHGATDEVRSQLVPVNRTHPLAEVMEAARHYARVTGRKVSFEYTVVPGVNDSAEQAKLLAGLVRGLPAMVNVIPRNPRAGGGAPETRPAQTFAAQLRELGLEVAVRHSRGAEVVGACGQLREEIGARRPSARGRKDAGRE